MASPICATSNGVFIAAANGFAKEKIRTLYFASASKESMHGGSLADILKKGEALIIRQTQSGIQNDLAWFRGILSPYQEDCWLSPAVFPRVMKNAALLVQPLDKAALAFEKGRVRQAILSAVDRIHVQAPYTALWSGDKQNAEAMLSRCKDILNELGEDAEIGAWALDDDQPHSEATSLLNEIWLEMSTGSYVVKFES
jgi:hypothetical protein